MVRMLPRFGGAAAKSGVCCGTALLQQEYDPVILMLGESTIWVSESGTVIDCGCDDGTSTGFSSRTRRTQWF
uniref:Peptidase A1 domain-containing protein n=1 Tax=Ascaris lumbricoides TaxID=6252 RepID=A0A0M3HQF0_ASCLU